MNGMVFWIYRDGVNPQNGHISENDKWEVDKYDVIVHNTELRVLQSELAMWWSVKGSKMR